MDEPRYRAAERRLWQSVGATPREQRLHLARNDVGVRVQEVGEGIPVVFVHGASNSGSSWAPLVARLEGFRCLLLDRPGCGLSDPLDRRLDTRALGEVAETLLVDVLDALGLAAAHVVATSFGGLSALRGAAAHPERIRRIVLFGWPVGAPIARVPAIMRVASVPVLGRLMSALPPNERAVRALLRHVGLRRAVDTGRFSQEALDSYLALLRDTDTMRNELRDARYLSLGRGLDERVTLDDDALAAVTAPIYFLWGEEDPFGGADIARRLVDRLPDAALELLAGAGHAVWIDAPDHAAATVTHFLRG